MAEDENVRRIGALMGPEGIIMIPMAISFDIIGIASGFIPYIGWIIGFGIAFLGFAFFNSWIWFRSIMVTEREAALRKKAVKGIRMIKTLRRYKVYQWVKWLRFIGPLAEAIPYLNWIPFWTILVCLEMMYSQ